MADIDAERLAAAAEPFAQVLAVPTDVGRWEDVQALADRARSRFGHVDVLCSNAGVTLSGRVWKATLDDVAWLLRVNLWGVVHGIKAFVPAMIERGEPAHVVNTASIGGLLGFPAIGFYSASKFAIVGLSESLRHDVRERGAPIGVSVLCPGATATGLDRNSAQLRGEEPVADPEGAVRARADDVAAQVLDAIRAERFWVLTHPGYGELLAQRHREMLGAEVELAAPGFFL